MNTRTDIVTLLNDWKCHMPPYPNIEVNRKDGGKVGP